MDSVKTWKTMGGESVPNWLEEIVKSTAEQGQRVVHVGTDSQQHARETEFVTVVVLLRPSKGGRVLWTRERVPRIRSLRERLLREVQMSVDIAMQINAVVSEDVLLNVHVDANPDVQFKSSEYLRELVGYVVGQGFSVLTKPMSWAAMHVADHVVKHKHER
jgi:hypothetical protein